MALGLSHPGKFRRIIEDDCLQACQRLLKIVVDQEIIKVDTLRNLGERPSMASLYGRRIVLTPVDKPFS